MNRKNALALLVTAGLQGTDALSTSSRTVSPKTVRLIHNLGHPTFTATHNDFTRIHYFYFDHKPRSAAQNFAPPASLQRLDESVQFRELDLFAVDCPESVDSIYYSNRSRWHWVDEEEAKAKIREQETWNAAVRAKVPAEEEDPENKFERVRESLESAKDCNKLVQRRISADLFVVTGASLRAIIQDEDLGRQVVRRWDGDMRGHHFDYCTWANVFRLAFGVSCGRAMYDQIRFNCDEEIELKDDCREDWTLDLMGNADDGITEGWNNEYMEYATYILRKAKKAAGMLIQYETYDPSVAIWDMKKIKKDLK